MLEFLSLKASCVGKIGLFLEAIAAVPVPNKNNQNYISNDFVTCNKKKTF